MTTIYLIRHAEAEGNLYRRIHGQYDSKITENGRRQIAALEARFRDVPIDAVYASDLSRTCHTARAIYVPKGLTLQRDPCFREVCVGAWEDVPFGELERNEQAQLQNFNHDPQNWHVDQAESWDTYTTRFLNGLEHVARREDGKSVAIFTHGTVMSKSIQRLFPDVNPGHSDNTAVTKLIWDGVFHLEYTADNSHLTPEISTLARQNWWRSNADRQDHNLWFLPYEDEIDWYLRFSDEAIPIAPMAVLQFAMLGDTPVGFLQLDPQRGQEDGIGFIDHLTVHKKYRHQDFGAQILGSAVSFYRSLGRTTLQIAVPERYQKNIPFLLYYGFQPHSDEIYALDIAVRDF